jgi:hypothetical protein
MNLFGTMVDRPGPALQLINCALASPVKVPIAGTDTSMQFSETSPWAYPYCFDLFQGSGADGSNIQVRHQQWWGCRESSCKSQHEHGADGEQHQGQVG